MWRPTSGPVVGAHAQQYLRQEHEVAFNRGHVGVVLAGRNKHSAIQHSLPKTCSAFTLLAHALPALANSNTLGPRNLQLQVFSTQLPESICSVDGGYVTSAAAADIIIHTFTGKVGHDAGDRACRRYIGQQPPTG